MGEIEKIINELMEAKKIATKEDIENLTGAIYRAYIQTETEDIERYRKIWELSSEARNTVFLRGFDIAIQAEVSYYGLFSGYYYLLKSLEVGREVLEEDINKLIEETEKLHDEVMTEQDIGQWIEYGYLLSMEYRLKTMLSITKAEKINQSIVDIGKKGGLVLLVLKGINSSGTAAEKAGDYKEAVKIFGKAEKFPEAGHSERERKIYADCLYNLGNNRVKLSDEIMGLDRKMDLLRLAIANFKEAEEIYRGIYELPKEYIEKIVDSVINASYRFIKMYEETISSSNYVGEKIKKAFTEEKNREKAITMIEEFCGEWWSLAISQAIEILQKAKN